MYIRVTSDMDMYMYLPSLLVNLRHLSDSAFCRCELALGGIALDFGIIVDNKLSCRNVCIEVTRMRVKFGPFGMSINWHSVYT